MYDFLLVLAPVSLALAADSFHNLGLAPPLVVDDNVDAADMLAMMLQMFGHEVQAAYSGESALEKAVGYQPEFVLLDIGLPDIDGYEVARRLRQEPQTKDVTADCHDRLWAGLRSPTL